jgi:hypothetical protein
MKGISRVTVVGIALVTAMLFGNATAFAHPHEASPAHHGEGQQLANGQNHGPFTTTTEGHGQTCGGDPAAYGLESAHHGPDAGDPGKADGCYETDSMPPGSDDENPAID